MPNNSIYALSEAPSRKVGGLFTIAIDQSTSATKAMLFDTAGKLYASISEEHQQYYPQPGWVEHNPLEILETT